MHSREKSHIHLLEVPQINTSWPVTHKEKEWTFDMQFEISSIYFKLSGMLQELKNKTEWELFKILCTKTRKCIMILWLRQENKLMALWMDMAKGIHEMEKTGARAQNLQVLFCQFWFLNLGFLRNRRHWRQPGEMISTNSRLLLLFLTFGSIYLLVISFVSCKSNDSQKDMPLLLQFSSLTVSCEAYCSSLKSKEQ